MFKTSETKFPEKSPFSQIYRNDETEDILSEEEEDIDTEFILNPKKTK